MSFEPATDCHVHLLPQRLLRAIRESLNDAAGWVVPRPAAPAVVEARHRGAGASRYFSLPYAHATDIAADLIGRSAPDRR